MQRRGLQGYTVESGSRSHGDAGIGTVISDLSDHPHRCTVQTLNADTQQRHLNQRGVAAEGSMCQALHLRLEGRR